MICIRKNLRLRAVMLLGLTGYHHDVKVIFQEQGVAAGKLLCNCHSLIYFTVSTVFLKKSFRSIINSVPLLKKMKQIET